MHQHVLQIVVYDINEKENYHKKLQTVRVLESDERLKT